MFASIQGGMNRKIKLAAAALLGFSTACSSVKNTPAKGSGEQEPVGTEVQTDTVRRIVVMYGVRTPERRQTGFRAGEPVDGRADDVSTGNGR